MSNLKYRNRLYMSMSCMFMYLYIYFDGVGSSDSGVYTRDGQG
jgi:hypothetical protein